VLKYIRYILEYTGRFDISENIGLVFSLIVVVISMYPCTLYATHSPF
jgi:hypothetical protein